MQRAPCPSCGSKRAHGIFSLESVPVHSCLLVPTREEAVAFPTGDLDLAVCPACGFVWNRRFDPGVHRYSARYEETQGCSGRFREFLGGLAERLVREHDLAGKTFLEIGCGKGEFAGLLATAGMTGTGIDPAFVPERAPAGARGRVRFIRDLWGERYAHLTADFVACRHTLEHIAPVADFVRTLRRSIGERTDTVVFFEVPDVLRELEEGAFQDFYYEHCSYFSPGSLARLFRAEGFEVTDLRLDYEEQYACLTARPAARPTEPTLPREDDLDAVVQLARAFPDTVAASVARWRDRIGAVLADGGRIALWGAGSKCVAFATALRLRDEIAAVTDINPVKQGCFLPGSGHEVVAPEALEGLGVTHVIAMNPVYVGEIRRDLAALSIDAEVTAL